MTPITRNYLPPNTVKDHLVPLPDLVAAAMEGKINAAPDKIFGLEDIAQAHEYCESSRVCTLPQLGKVH